MEKQLFCIVCYTLLGDLFVDFTQSSWVGFQSCTPKIPKVCSKYATPYKKTTQYVSNLWIIEMILVGNMF